MLLNRSKHSAARQSLESGLVRSLLNEVLISATDSNRSLTDLLRKILVIATHLGEDKVLSWVLSELNGYKEVEVPLYRRLPVQALADVFGPFGSGAKNLRIPTSAIKQENLREIFEQVEVRDPIEALESKVAKGKDELSFELNANLYPIVNEILTGYSCGEVTLRAGSGSATNIVSQVRNRVLEFALLLLTEYPHLVDDPEASKKDHKAMTEKAVTIINYGSQQLAIDSDSAFHNSELSVQAGNTESLIARLSELGILGKDARDILEILDSCDESPPSRIEKLKRWTYQRINAAGSFASKASAKALPALLEAAGKHYLHLD